MSITIRRMRDNERTRFIERIVSTTRDDLPPYLRHRVTDKQLAWNVSDVIELLLDQGDNVILVADMDGLSNMGQIWLGTARDPYTGTIGGYIYDLHIDATVRGQGIGKALLAAAEQASRQRGDKMLGLAVATWNDTARHLYESAGFEPERLTMSKSFDDLHDS